MVYGSISVLNLLSEPVNHEEEPPFLVASLPYIKKLPVEAKLAA